MRRLERIVLAPRRGFLGSREKPELVLADAVGQSSSSASWPDLSGAAISDGYSRAALGVFLLIAYPGSKGQVF